MCPMFFILIKKLDKRICAYFISFQKANTRCTSLEYFFIVENIRLNLCVEKIKISFSEAHFFKTLRHDTLPEVRAPCYLVGHNLY